MALSRADRSGGLDRNTGRSRPAARPTVNIPVEEVMDAVDRHVRSVVQGQLAAALDVCGYRASSRELIEVLRELPSPVLSATVEEVKHLGRNFDARVRYVGSDSTVVIVLHWHVDVAGGTHLTGFDKARSVVLPGQPHKPRQEGRAALWA